MGLIQADSSGTLVIGTDTVTEVSFPIVVTTEVITQHTGRGRILIPAEASADVIPIGNITNIVFIWIKVVRSSDELIAETLAKINLTKAGPTVVSFQGTHALLWISNPKADGDISVITVDGNATEDTIVEYVIAGDA